MLDETDRRILNLIQEEFPLSERPFDAIGESVGVPGAEALRRVQRLKEEGVIRRIGPVLERRKLGYASALCGVRVDAPRIELVAREISKQTGITHNYEREGELNLWFTITKKTKEEVDEFIRGMEARFNLTIHRFPARKVFKIKTFFPL